MRNQQKQIVESVLSSILNFMLPLRVLLRVYSLFILLIDTTWVIVNAIGAVVESFYHVFCPPKLKSLSFETALVIGAGRGLGREIALQLAQLGAVVLCVDNNKTNNESVVQEIKKKYGVSYSYIYDITKKENIALLARRVKRDAGAITMLFYCCGIPSPRSLLTQPSPDVHQSMDLTLTAFYWLVDHYMPEMKEKNHGHIVALTSVASLSVKQDQTPLSIAQFAVQGLAESMLEDIRLSKKDGVHVTLIHIYPFIVSPDVCPDLRLRIPSFFGTITPELAASAILDSVRRNYVEVSVPSHLLYLGHLLRILPRKATVLIREYFDTGVDFV